MAARWQKLDIEIPENLSRSQRREVADLVIDHIIRRTQGGKDKNGRNFPKYSKEYIASLDFKIAGKSPREIDLTLSGDMLASLELLSENRGTIRIGFEKGSEENARADGNIRGTYGRSKGDAEKARDFLGIEPKALRQIIREVSDED